MTRNITYQILKQILRFFTFAILLIFILEIIIMDFEFQYLKTFIGTIISFSIVGGFLYAFPNKFIEKQVQYSSDISKFENQLSLIIPNLNYIIISRDNSNFVLGLKNKFRHLLMWKDDLITIKYDNNFLTISGRKYIVEKITTGFN